MRSRVWKCNFVGRKPALKPNFTYWLLSDLKSRLSFDFAWDTYTPATIIIKTTDTAGKRMSVRIKASRSRNRIIKMEQTPVLKKSIMFRRSGRRAALYLWTVLTIDSMLFKIVFILSWLNSSLLCFSSISITDSILDVKQSVTMTYEQKIRNKCGAFSLINTSVKAFMRMAKHDVRKDGWWRYKNMTRKEKTTALPFKIIWAGCVRRQSTYDSSVIGLLRGLAFPCLSLSRMPLHAFLSALNLLGAFYSRCFRL